jgi:DNA-binding response OmpR family regulator
MSSEHSTLPSSNAASPALPALPILVVDDDPFILDLLCDVFEEAGFVVLTADDGRAALALLQHMPVALVLTDLMMPYVTGLQLAQQLRSNAETVAIPVVLMSTALPPRIGDTFAAVIPKPFALDDLVATVRQFGSNPEGNASRCV